MLYQATLKLATDGWSVWAMARDANRLNRLAQDTSIKAGIVIPLPVDYCDGDQLKTMTKKAMLESGGFTMALCWIHQHSKAPEAPGIIARQVSLPGKPFDYYDIVGSGQHSNELDQVKIESELASIPGLVYHKIVLGSILEGSSCRWLTDNEISMGVIAAINSGASLTLVGN